MREEIVKIIVAASCLSCRKSTLHDLDDGKIYCEVSGDETSDDFDCPEWECNFDIFNVCGFEVRGLELPSLLEAKTIDDKNINLAKNMGYTK
ncbi:MAG: hypothetical protein NTW78_05865 [Campylobacterales bacterium]|nr:hypothetical protein [Campylobacterales bacterium]